MGAIGMAGGISILAGGIVCARFGDACSETSSIGSDTSASFALDETSTGDLDTGPRLATIAAASAAIGEVKELFFSSALGVEGPETSLGKRGLFSAGERFEGRVLLLCTPDVVGLPTAGVIGLGTAEVRERFDDVDTFLRTPLYFLTLSAPALDAAEIERPMPVPLRPGVVGVMACGVDGPLSMCLTVPSSTAVPSIPIKK